MSTPREGGCTCGAVRYRLASEPLFTHCCHCLNCQRQTGSAFVINLLIETDRVGLLAGDPQPVDAPRDDGSTQRIFRCPNCQVAVFSHYGHPGVAFVRGGTLDEPSSVVPDVHIFTRSKLPWITLPDSAPAFEVYYDSQALWPAASLERLATIMAAARPDARIRAGSPAKDVDAFPAGTPTAPLAIARLKRNCNGPTRNTMAASLPTASGRSRRVPLDLSAMGRTRRSSTARSRCSESPTS